MANFLFIIGNIASGKTSVINELLKSGLVKYSISSDALSFFLMNVCFIDKMKENFGEIFLNTKDIKELNYIYKSIQFIYSEESLRSNFVQDKEIDKFYKKVNETKYKDDIFFTLKNKRIEIEHGCDVINKERLKDLILKNGSVLENIESIIWDELHKKRAEILSILSNNEDDECTVVIESPLIDLYNCFRYIKKDTKYSILFLDIDNNIRQERAIMKKGIFDILDKRQSISSILKKNDHNMICDNLDKRVKNVLNELKNDNCFDIREVIFDKSNCSILNIVNEVYLNYIIPINNKIHKKDLFIRIYN